MKILNKFKLFALIVVLITIKSPGALAGDYTILAFGDSLTAGYGLPDEQGFTRQLKKALEGSALNILGNKFTVINGGVSGDTTSGGLRRLPWALSGGKLPDLVILELGANDALRGISPDITRANMDKMLLFLKEKRVRTLVAGMLAPPNMGSSYGKTFNRIFSELSQEYGVKLYPFFLDGVAGDAQLNQNDAIHPNADGVAIIVKKIIPYIFDSLELTPSSSE